MRDNSFSSRRILIIQQRSWGMNVGHFLAKKLAGDGARLAAVTYKKGAHAFHISQEDVQYEMLINNDEVIEDPTKYLKGAPASLEEITRELGITSIWPLVAASREITRSYGGRYFFAGRQQMSDEEIVRYIQGTYAYVVKIFDEFKPHAVIAPLIVEPSHQMIYYMARKRNVKTLCITDSKIRGAWIVSESVFENEGPFYDRVDALNAGATSTNIARARTYIAEFRAQFKRPTYADRFDTSRSAWKRIRYELAPYREIWKWYTKPHVNCVAPLGPTLDCKPPRIILRDHYVHHARARVQKNFSYYPLEKVGKYAYYPLQVEPEATLDVFAPYFTDQRHLAKQVAMSLPADYTLVVKDHPAMLGLRSTDFIKDLAGTPNIKLVDYREDGTKILKKSALVLAPNSTSLFEAAFYGVSAIQFGNQGTTLKSPNVVRHTDMTTLIDVIADRIGKRFSGDDYEQKLENFVAAVYDSGMEVDREGAWYEGKPLEMEKLWQMYRKELERIL